MGLRRDWTTYCWGSVQVNSFGSLAQAVAVFLLLPGLAALRGISFTELPQYLTEGAHVPTHSRLSRLPGPIVGRQ